MAAIIRNPAVTDNCARLRCTALNGSFAALHDGDERNSDVIVSARTAVPNRFADSALG
jgi:hypothetical protein